MPSTCCIVTILVCRLLSNKINGVGAFIFPIIRAMAAARREAMWSRKFLDRKRLRQRCPLDYLFHTGSHLACLSLLTTWSSWDQEFSKERKLHGRSFTESAVTTSHLRPSSFDAVRREIRPSPQLVASLQSGASLYPVGSPYPKPT